MKKKMISSLLLMVFISGSICIPAFADNLLPVEVELNNEEFMSEEEWDTLQKSDDKYTFEMEEQKKLGYTGVRYAINDEEEHVATVSNEEENEPNDTRSKADRIYVDDRTYGTIEDEDDIDYYKIKFPSAGYAKVMLRSVPDACDYDLYFYGSGGDKIDFSISGLEGDSETLYSFVTPDCYYYIKVKGYDSSYDDTDEYYVRVTLDEDIEEFAFCVGTDYKLYGYYDEIDTSDDAELAAETFTNCGYRGVICTTPTVHLLDGVNSDGTDRLGSSIVFINGHGAPKHIRLSCNGLGNSGTIKYNTGVSTTYSDYDQVLGPDIPIFVPLKEKNIEDSRLMIFMGCSTAGEPDSGSNLPEYAVDHGAETAIGWEVDVPEIHLADWNECFLEKLQEGYSVLDAACEADEIFSIGADITKWRIYGNEDNVINRNGPYNLSLNTNNLIDSEYEEDVVVDVLGEDFSALEEIIQTKNSQINLDNYVKSVDKVAENTYKVNYILYDVDGFNTNCGYSVLIEDNVVTKVSEKNTELLLTSDDITINDEMITYAKKEAAKEINKDFEIVNQKVNKVIHDSRHCLEVYTSYALDYGTEYETHGCKVYYYFVD